MKKIFEKYKFLQDMIYYAMGTIPSSDFRHFCQFFFLLNRNAYANACNFLPKIPIRTIYDNYSSIRHQKNDELCNVDSIQSLLSNNYQFEDEEKNSVEHITLAGDAASIKRMTESRNSAIYTYLAVPLKKKRNH